MRSFLCFEIRGEGGTTLTHSTASDFTISNTKITSFTIDDVQFTEENIT